jgi:hypothetical protein
MFTPSNFSPGLIDRSRPQVMCHVGYFHFEELVVYASMARLYTVSVGWHSPDFMMYCPARRSH